MFTPASLLQQLIRFDTTNPPGNERPCVEFIRDLLFENGITSELLALDNNRPNLVARIPGEGTAPPLLLYGHVDVVTTAGQTWTRDPFAAEEHDGWIWGRGALDMKGGVAMILSAVMRLNAEGTRPPGDIILAIVCDEEAGGDYGAGFLVDKHGDRFAGVKHAIGEFGGFSMHIAGRKLYPIQVAEKQACRLRVTLRGPGGHGSLPSRGGTMRSLSTLLDRLDRRRLPVHVTPVAKQMIGEIARALPTAMGAAVRLLGKPAFTDMLLDRIGPGLASFDALLHNTVNATVVRSGEKINVIPSEATIELDGRILPGFTPDHLIAEMRAIVGNDVEIECTRYEPGPRDVDMSWYPELAAIMRELDPSGTPVPLMLPGVTDARHFTRLGIQTYGFLPMNLPPGFNFTGAIHNADERIPVETLEMGTRGIVMAMKRR